MTSVHFRPLSVPQDLKLSTEMCRIYSLYHSLHHYKYHTFLHCKTEVQETSHFFGMKNRSTVLSLTLCPHCHTVAGSENHTGLIWSAPIMQCHMQYIHDALSSYKKPIMHCVVWFLFPL